MSPEGYLLSTRSYFSSGESMLSPKDIIRLAKEAGYHTVALTDTMTISGMMEFIAEAKAQEIKPIIGCRLRIVMDLEYRKPAKKELILPKDNPEWYPKVFVKNEEGMRDLMNLLTLANKTDHFFSNARLSLEDLCAALSRGNLIVSTGDFQSVFHCILENLGYDYLSIINKLKTSSKNDVDVKIELLAIDTLLHSTINKKAFKTALELDLENSIIVTRPILYADSGDADSRDVLATINANQKIKDPWRNIPYVRDFAFVDANYMAHIKTTLHGDALKADEELSDACTYVWEKKPISLPKIVEDETRAMLFEVTEGWKNRIQKEVMGYKPDKSLIPIYKERLAYELKILKSMGFERYFLVVQDLIKWSKSNGIMVGPGRGSSSGSLVSFLMGITDLDPIRFNLIFERFINPSRLDLPDADIDFMSTRRTEVIDYLVKKYGEKRVAGISNYTQMGSAGALRNVGRVHEIPIFDLNVTKLIPKEHGASFSLEEALQVMPDLVEFKKRYSEVWRHAQKLEGVMTGLGRHAAGVIIAGEDIEGSGRAVIEDRCGKIVNWDKTTVEDWGLVKVDVLGLSTLDVLRITIESVFTRTGEKIDLLSIPLDDQKTLRMLGKGDTDCVFQFTSGGMKSILKQLAETGSLKFEDLCATTALYRPGPMESGMIEDYINWRATGDEPVYEHPNMQASLGKTGGSMIYQEQVMQLSSDLAGYTLAEADVLRKIMGKKKPEEMAKQREKFVNGCVNHSAMDEKLAEKVFENIEKFAGYGFNASHAFAYSVISYWCAYLKKHYPLDFFAATMTIEDDEDKLRATVRSAKKSHVIVVPPDINVSTEKFEIGTDDEGNEVLYCSFSKLKGLSEKSAKAILEARANVGKFTSAKHFEDSVNRRNVNIRVREALDKVGAFASVEPTQPRMSDELRLKDQIELLPGLMAKYVKPNRKIKVDLVATEIMESNQKIRNCVECDLTGNCSMTTAVGENIRFAIVTDYPSSNERAEGGLFMGKGRDTLMPFMKEAGLTATGGYFTSVVKNKGEEKLNPEQIAKCKGYLEKEMSIIAPPVIVCMGGAAIRHFYPEAKGGWAEMCGQVIYDKERDATIIFGINPAMTYFRDEAKGMIVDVFKILKEVLS